MNELSQAAAGLEVLRRALSHVHDGQLDCRTPCRDYDVRELAEHLADSVTRISAAAGVAVPRSRHGAIVQLADVGRDTVAGWGRRGLDGHVPFAGRTMAARDLLGVIALEFVVHGWDFATAVGTRLSVPDDLAGDLLQLAHRIVTTESRRVAGFDEPLAIGADATALDRLLAYTGRDPSTKPLLH